MNKKKNYYMILTFFNSYSKWHFSVMHTRPAFLLLQGVALLKPCGTWKIWAHLSGLTSSQQWQLIHCILSVQRFISNHYILRNPLASLFLFHNHTLFFPCDSMPTKCYLTRQWRRENWLHGQWRRENWLHSQWRREDWLHSQWRQENWLHSQ